MIDHYRPFVIAEIHHVIAAVVVYDTETLELLAERVVAALQAI